MFATVHRKENSPERKITDYLPYLKAWPEPDDGTYSEIDREILKELL